MYSKIILGTLLVFFVACTHAPDVSSKDLPNFKSSPYKALFPAIYPPILRPDVGPREMFIYFNEKVMGEHEKDFIAIFFEEAEPIYAEWVKVEDGVGVIRGYHYYNGGFIFEKASPYPISKLEP